MLRQINPSNLTNQLSPVCEKSVSDDRWGRNEEDDLKEAIGYLYDFRKKLGKLHPNVLDIMDNMLQRNRY